MQSVPNIYNRPIKFQSSSSSVLQLSNRFNLDDNSSSIRKSSFPVRSSLIIRPFAPHLSAPLKSDIMTQEIKAGILLALVKFISEDRDAGREYVHVITSLKRQRGWKIVDELCVEHNVHHESWRALLVLRYGNRLIFTRGSFEPPVSSDAVSYDAVSGLLAAYKFVPRASELSWIMYRGGTTISTLTLKRADGFSRIEEREARAARDHNLRWDDTVNHIVLTYVYLRISLRNECFTAMEIFEFQARVYVIHIV